MSESAAPTPVREREMLLLAALASGALALFVLWGEYAVFLDGGEFLAFAVLFLTMAATLLRRSSVGPFLLLLVVARLEFLADRSPVGAARSSNLLGVGLATLVYVQMHFRYVAAHEALRPKSPPPLPEALEGAAIGALLRGVVAALAYPFAAVVVWQTAPAVDPRVPAWFFWPPTAGVLVGLVWLLGMLAIVGRVAATTVLRWHKDPGVATLELNDTVWTDLRPELKRTAVFLGNAARRQAKRGES